MQFLLYCKRFCRSTVSQLRVAFFIAEAALRVSLSPAWQTGFLRTEGLMSNCSYYNTDSPLAPARDGDVGGSAPYLATSLSVSAGEGLLPALSPISDQNSSTVLSELRSGSSGRGQGSPRGPRPGAGSSRWNSRGKKKDPKDPNAPSSGPRPEEVAPLVSRRPVQFFKEKHILVEMNELRGVVTGLLSRSASPPTPPPGPASVTRRIGARSRETNKTHGGEVCTCSVSHNCVIGVGLDGYCCCYCARGGVQIRNSRTVGPL